MLVGKRCIFEALIGIGKDPYLIGYKPSLHPAERPAHLFSGSCDSIYRGQVDGEETRAGTRLEHLRRDPWRLLSTCSWWSLRHNRCAS